MLYEYRCIDCSCQDKRIAALDDHTAICHHCGGLMLRQDDPFEDRPQEAPGQAKETAP